MWSPILLGGDARYLNGDPLIVVLEWIAFFVGLFEAYALVQFFRNGKRFTSTQLSFIMGGMIVEVTLPAVYFGVEIANNLESMTSPVEMWIKFVVLNLLWCTMPLVTYFWGVRQAGQPESLGDLLSVCGVELSRIAWPTSVRRTDTPSRGKPASSRCPSR